MNTGDIKEGHAGIPVTVKIESSFLSEDGTDRLSQEYSGFRRREGETDLVDYDGGRMEIAPDRVRIEERGEMHADILLRADDKLYETAFSSAYGDLLLGLKTRQLRILKGAGIIGISAHYRTLADGETLNEVQMKIVIRDRK